VFVACSTHCFGRRSLEDTLRIIGELEFTKFDVAIHEQSRHLRPSEVLADVGLAAQKLRMGAGLTPAAFSLAIEADNDEDHDRQFQAVCRLARISAVPLVTISTAPADTGLDVEVERLKRLVALAEAEGILLAVTTEIGTLTEDPDRAVTLCERVPGLSLTLDPSHYVNGPHQGKNYDQVFPFVRHVQLRDSGRGPNQFQVRVGQGEIEYGRIITHLARNNYDRALTVDVREVPDSPVTMEPEVRKLKYLLESLV
jgi:sugar phosphate isomerase/epimerase